MAADERRGNLILAGERIVGVVRQSKGGSTAPTNDHDMPSAMFSRRFAANYFSTLGFIGLSYWIISTLSGFHRGMLQGQWQFGMFGVNAALSIHALLIALIGLYALVLIPYYARYPWLHSKAFVFLQGLRFSLLRLRRPVSPARQTLLSREKWRLPLRSAFSPAAKQAGLALLLKFFFAPLMINWCLNHMADMSNSIMQVFDGLRAGVTGRELFDTSLFWACFQLILFVDTLLFTLGYIIEVPALNNRIRSVDPTFFGWFICLICYPPFNDFTGRFLEWQSNDFPHFESSTFHFIANITLLTSLAIYSSASVALGFKASNLTNRGIVSHGPYSVVRHPAYAAKNFAWWIGAMPTLYFAFASGSARTASYALLAMCGWTTIYVLRAITEERHLLLLDNGYAQYMARVKWRFIPGVV
jgi:protein-S-isoprenylcysteine O-methyltransferase Ste14